MTRVTAPRAEPVRPATLARAGRPSVGAWAVPCAAALLTAVVTAYLTRTGLGYGYDGIVYMGSAERMARTGTLGVPFSVPLRTDPSIARAVQDSTTPLVHWPPGFPMMLAAVVITTGDVLDAAWLLNVVALAATVGVIALLLTRTFSPLVGALGAALYALTPAVIQVHFEVLSEPLFVALMAATIAGMALAPERSWAYGVTAAAALLTRYLGVGLVGAVALYAARLPGSPRERARRVALAIAPSVVLTAALVALDGSAGGRRLTYYPGIEGPLHRAAGTVAYVFVTPLVVHSRALAVAVGALVVVTMLGLVAARPWARGAPGAAADAVRARLLSLIGITIAALAAVLLLTRSFADPQLDFDGRILLPVILLAELALVILTGCWVQGRSRRWPTVVLCGAGAALTLLAAEDVMLVRELQRQPRGYPSLSMEHQPVAARLGAFRRDPRPIFADAPDLVWWYARRSARTLPDLTDARGIAVLRTAVAPRGGVIVRFRGAVPGDAVRRAVCPASVECAWVDRSASSTAGGPVPEGSVGSARVQ